ncbi:thiamine ABC transporter substrate-binding protein [Nocardioides psychrotolerans]|uniref:Thiamine transport system substrate-binding protein n=1 Tax=Nocardioides psychrotolerans TaxID=1005945 RepID=A0A1I3N0I7_9ACTN|nr:thiamine ABC transporter substrate-binding protein [Nocardioides psychrotolerans]GEP39075.1 thiamine ABC transporter substrate-binding protein [Nocardioides psychrotolerans]SFJ02520.1 thiamine transport system substrate-binding protein [Nocardioides psychrotolerans]
MKSISAVLLTCAFATASCSLIGTGDDEEQATAKAGSEVVLVTHESFVLPDEVRAAFEEQSGFELVVRASGDAGSLTNKLVLTKDDPTGDVAFGVDNTFASRALEEGVFEGYEHTTPAGVSDFDLDGDDEHALTPVDNGNVCVNVDDTWFETEGIAPPETLDDLTDPTYEDLFVLPSAATSSPGLAFLLTTIAAKGDAWPDFWADLMDNGALLTSGWSEAYQGDFTQGGGKGTRPIVLSYDSSPAFTVDGEGGTTTSALLDTCFTQVEYAGVLAGAANPEGARALVDFLTGPEVQAALPDSMYVFPVAEGTALPEDWATFAQQPTDPWEVDPAEVAANRDDWLTQWRDVTTG